MVKWCSPKVCKNEDASLTIEAITALLQQFREGLASKFTSSANMLSSKLDQARQALEEQTERESSLELATEDLSQQVASLEDSYATLCEDNTKLKDKVTDLESRSRLQNIRILGLPENTESRPRSFLLQHSVRVFWEGCAPDPTRTW